MEKGFVVISVLIIAGGLHLGNANKGKLLFEQPGFSGGITGTSCMTCHEGGKGLGRDLFQRKDFTTMGVKTKSLADVVNVCIENPLEGVGLDPQGEDMKYLLAYIQTLVSHPAKK